MKRILFILLSVVCITTAGAQDIEEEKTEEKEKVAATLGIDLVNQYIWRGQDLGFVSIQPTLGIGYKGLSLSTWGSVGIANANDTKELDLTLSYTIKGFQLGVTDYWFSAGKYFQYRNSKTTHIFEGFVGYDFGFLSAMWYTYFAGDDGTNKNDKRAYSSYFELAAPFRLGGLDWEAKVGVVPWYTTLYNTDGFAVTNISLKAAKVFTIKKKYELPVYVGLTTNPDAQKFYLLCGVAFSYKH
ncbi:MAG: hypothetical protein J6Y04_04225 [Bacteroidaceae bacterium]|nr:hypothetical protein [Bacteroidaceae bacterium]